MRILLICLQYADIVLPGIASDSFYRLSESVSRHRRPSATTIMPIGLSYVAAVLEKRHTVKLLYQDVTASEVREFDPDIVGISCIMSLQESISFELAGFIKKIKPGAKIIVGGTHPSALPERMLADENIDFVILGEGEHSMLELAERLQSNEPVGDVDGLAYRKDGSIRVNQKNHLIENLDELPFPSLVFDETVPKCISVAHNTWDRIALLSFAADKYSGIEAQADRLAILDRRKKSFDIKQRFDSTKSELAWKQRRIQCLVTSRGCPFDCSYCTSQMMWKKQYRTRSVENLVEEVGRFPEREIVICDENMTLDRGRAKRLFNAVAPLKKKFFFYNGVDPYTLDDELIKAMGEGGVAKLSISIETGSPDTSKQLHRRLDFEKIKTVLSSLRKNRILTAVYFITGFPGETEADVRRTIEVMEYCMKNFPVIVHIYKFLLLPGSRLYSMHCSTMNPNFDDHCFFPVEHYELFQLKDSVALIPLEINQLIDISKYSLCAIEKG